MYKWWGQRVALSIRTAWTAGRALRALLLSWVKWRHLCSCVRDKMYPWQFCNPMVPSKTQKDRYFLSILHLYFPALNGKFMPSSTSENHSSINTQEGELDT